MIILLVILCWLLSISLRIISTGVNSLNKIQNKVSDDIGKNIKKQNSDSKEIKETSRVAVKTVANTATKVTKATINFILLVVDIIRNILTTILPYVLILDIIVFLLLSVTASGYLLLLDVESDGTSSVTASASSNGNSGSSNKNILLIGDSRTVQLGTTVFGMSHNTGSDGLPVIKDKTDNGDYLYCKGSIGLSWMKSEESGIDSKVSGNTAVVINMGVNDCASSSSASEYISYINSKVDTWTGKGADVYFVSVNPINDRLARNNGYGVTNKNVTDFNKEVKNGLNSAVKYIDTYSEVKNLVIDKSETSDGIHYNTVVYEKIKSVIWGKIKTSGGDLKSSFKAINQNPELPTGCEVTSLTMVLNHLGFDVGKGTIADNYLEKGPVGSTDFNKKFVGDPRDDSSYGCYAPVITKAANKYLSAKGSSLKATNTTGKGLEELFTYIDSGTPVIVWGTIDNKQGRYTTTWNVDGKTIQWYSPEHCMVLVGYDDSKIWVADPMHGDIRSYDRSTFNDRFNSLFKQSVVIK